MQVCNALTRTRKEEIVADLKEKLQDSVIVFGMRFKGLDVSTSSRSVGLAIGMHCSVANGPALGALRRRRRAAAAAAATAARAG